MQLKKREENVPFKAMLKEIAETVPQSFVPDKNAPKLSEEMAYGMDVAHKLRSMAEAVMIKAQEFERRCHQEADAILERFHNLDKSRDMLLSGTDNMIAGLAEVAKTAWKPKQVLEDIKQQDAEPKPASSEDRPSGARVG